MAPKKCKGNTCEFNPRWCWWVVVVDVIFIIFFFLDSVKTVRRASTRSRDWKSCQKEKTKTRVVNVSQQTFRAVKFVHFDDDYDRLLNSWNVRDLRWLKLELQRLRARQHTRSSLQCRASECMKSDPVERVRKTKSITIEWRRIRRFHLGACELGSPHDHSTTKLWWISRNYCVAWELHVHFPQPQRSLQTTITMQFATAPNITQIAAKSTSCSYRIPRELH